MLLIPLFTSFRIPVIPLSSITADTCQYEQLFEMPVMTDSVTCAVTRLTSRPSKRPSRAAKHCWMMSGEQMVAAVALMGACPAFSLPCTAAAFMVVMYSLATFCISTLHTPTTSLFTIANPSSHCKIGLALRLACTAAAFVVLTYFLATFCISTLHSPVPESVHHCKS